MGSLFVDRKNIEVRMYGGALVFYDKGTRSGSVPLAAVDRIFFYGAVTVNTSVLNRLGDAGIGAVFLSGFKHEPVLLLPVPHNDAERRTAQCCLSMNDEFCRLFSLRLIQEKLASQCSHLDELVAANQSKEPALIKCRNLLEADLSRSCKSNDLEEARGYEGHGSRVYFEGLGSVIPPAFGFSGRNRQPPRDPFNALLSLTYTIMTAEAGLFAYGAGLDPYVGFLHRNTFGRQSFACDLVEPFRTLGDRFVLGLIRGQTVRPEDFTTTTEGVRLGKAGRARFYQAYEEAAPEWRTKFDAKARVNASEFVTAMRAKAAAEG